jgi:hypothetical protein
MRTILFIVWAFSFLAFGYHALWCEPTLQNIHYTVFFGCVYIITYHEWKEAEREEEFNRRVVEQGRKLREEMKGKIQNYEEIIDYIENLSKTK